MTRFILVRHGQSQANAEERFAGHYDAPLTEHGHAQARATAQYVVGHYKIDAIYSSDLLRAYHTGKPAADLLGIEIIPDEGLREIFEGEWSGKKFLDLPIDHPEDFYVWRTDIGHARCTGGESTAELLVRVRAALERIAGENDGRTVLITTHATPIRVMQTFAEKGSLEEMQNVPWVTNASVSELLYDNGEWRFTRVSYDEHLGELKVAPPRNV
ncbi:MAG: histidine phosphatase family protein [Clostridia bacterium]|nr:histidine phosphatase family protein [Clostridia bacterium]MBR4034913.1 histidine phosphatase family protein [Clostridia bacterium]